MQPTPEHALIGDIILDPSVLPAVRMLVRSGEIFGTPKSGQIYDALLAVIDQWGCVDLPVLNMRLEKLGIPPTDLMIYQEAASPSQAGVHARWTVEQYAKRSTAKALAALQYELATGLDVYEAIGTAQSLLTDLRRQFEQERTVPISTVVREGFDDLEEIFSGRRSMGIPFGFYDIDRVTGGMDNGDLVVVAAPEKSGKSTIMLQTVFHNAQRGVPCLIFSTEMMRKQILYRKAMIDAGVRWIDVKNNRLDDSAKRDLFDRIRDMASLPIYIRHGMMSILDIAGDAERFIKDKGVRLVAVDYIQRVVPVTKRTNENREREVAAISSGLKNIAMEHGVVVMALSQVNDDMRARESRAIEQDMDKMITIERRPDAPDMSTLVSTDITIKQRMGLGTGKGDIKLLYDLISGSWKNEAHDLPVPGREY